MQVLTEGGLHPMFPMALAGHLTGEAAPAKPLLPWCASELDNIFAVVNVMHSQIPLCLQQASSQ